MKKFTKAPLPFVGQKRNFLKHFEKILNDNIDGDGEGWTIVDAFGDSGLLAHTAKYLKPKARVIYNDFDGYLERLNHIDDINLLKNKLLAKLTEWGCSKHHRFSHIQKQEIIKIIESFEGYKNTNILVAWLNYAGHQAKELDEVFSNGIVNRIPKTDYQNADGYLEGVEVVCESFEKLLPKYKENKNTLFILDPPYICTRQDNYKQETFFNLIDFLKLIYLTRPPFIFFSSTKSEFINYINSAIKEKWEVGEKFKDYKKISLKVHLNQNSMYEDNIVYKF